MTGVTAADGELIEVDRIIGGPGSPAGRVAIRIADGRIAELRPIEEPLNGTVVMVAPTNAHDHGRGLRTLAFGAVDDALECWLLTLSREPKVAAYPRAAVAFARMAEGGVANTNHSHTPQNPGGIVEECAEVSRAARDVGIRVAFAAPFSDRNPIVYGDPAPLLAKAPALSSRLQGRPMTGSTVEDYLRRVEEMAAFEHAGFAIQYCPVGPQWVSDPALAAIADASAATGRRVHMHLLETRTQREWADHAYPEGIVRFMDTIGLLSPRLSVAHGVYLREDECELLAERGVIVSVNTSSNFRLRSGIAPVGQFLRTGLRFGVGLDAQPMDDDDDMLREMRLVWLNHRGFGMEDVLGRDRLIEALTIDGRRAVLGEDGGGRIAVGAPADLLVLDLAAMTPDLVSPDEDALTVILTRATRRHIRRLVVAGRTVVADGRCVTVDLPALEAGLIAEARATWRTPPGSRDEMIAHVRRYYRCGCHVGQPFVAE
jgi:cytosine/adenosine deaminase-related metal-dependent hydrolase